MSFLILVHALSLFIYGQDHGVGVSVLNHVGHMVGVWLIWPTAKVGPIGLAARNWALVDQFPLQVTNPASCMCQLKQFRVVVRGNLPRENYMRTIGPIYGSLSGPPFWNPQIQAPHDLEVHRL